MGESVMRRTLLYIVIILLQGLISYGQTPQKDFPVLKGPYLGQKPPGMTPEIFAPGIVSIPDVTEWSGHFSPDGTEYYFYRFSQTLQPAIFMSKVIDGKWTKPEPAAFAGGYPSFQSHIPFDNKTIYFAWKHPLPQGESGNPNLPGTWAANRIANGWSTPEYAGQGMFLSSSRDGQLYITDLSAYLLDGKAYLAKLTLNNGRFSGFERLTGGMDALRAQGLENQAHPCIAPDGSWGEAKDLRRL
ncbi:MAG: hypothetical protein A2028_01390 [Candidatus Aminicenantes bacterium RBG_19FT_COMBO_59_29]|nr:MAG: hypothetical protein A2028_01390 [Candidatus Aminicenantes bacterium RBG_19FT_COMBO_59_29]